MRTYARFATAPIGPLLIATDGGLTLQTLDGAVNLARTARCDVVHSVGIRGAEFTFWGDAPLSAAIGVVQEATPLNVQVGAAATGVGWRLETGQVHVNNAVVASGLPIVAKGDTVGVRVLLDGGNPIIEFYRGAALVHSRALAAGAGVAYAVSIATAAAGTLQCAVNAGQWQGRSAAVLAGGWQPAAAALATVRLSDWDWLSDPTDAPANARYEGVVDPGGLITVAALGFWPWGDDPPMQGGSAEVTVLDADGLLDSLTQQDVSGVPVSVRLGDLDGSLATATAVARFACDRVQILDDGRKTIHLRDAHDDLDEPLARGVFLPNITALAWRAQPVVIGAVASVPALNANSDGSVAWLADAPLAEVSAVLDRGDAMEAGTWTLTPDKQQLYLSQPPIGPLVVDASSIGPAMQPATLQQAQAELFRRINKSAWSSADAAAIDLATGYAGVGYYVDDAGSVRRALAAILPSYGGWWWQAPDGVLRVARVVDPASVAVGALAFDLVDSDLASDIDAEPDAAPRLSRRMAYRPNARVLTAAELVTDLVDVPVWRRAELTSPCRGQAYSAKPLAPRYAHADTAAPLVSCFWRSQDAQTEIDRVCALYTVVRSFYRVHVQGQPLLAPNPGQVGRITYPRYGLDAGKQLLVRKVQRNPATGEVVLTLWG